MKLLKKNNYLEVVVDLKNTQVGSASLSFSHNGISFVLNPVTYNSLANNQLIEQLSLWRKKHQFWFQSIFPVTDQRTKLWLKEKVLDIPDRVLFLIQHDSSFLGHVGLFRYNELKKSVDIDNIVRGVEGYPGLMESALTVLMQWGKERCGIKIFTLQTTSDNQKALALYSRLGFTEVSRHPLVWKQADSGGEWVNAPEGYQQDIKRFEVYMERK